MLLVISVVDYIICILFSWYRWAQSAKPEDGHRMHTSEDGTQSTPAGGQRQCTHLRVHQPIIEGGQKSERHLPVPGQSEH